MGFLEQLRERAEAAQKEATKARGKANEAISAAERAEAEATAYAQAVAAEERKQGRTPAKPVVASQQQTLVPGIRRSASDKTGVALNVIAVSGANGASADDIEFGLKAHNFEFKRNYVFNIVSRLKSAGKIEQRGKRYYLKQSA